MPRGASAGMRAEPQPLPRARRHLHGVLPVLRGLWAPLRCGQRAWRHGRPCVRPQAHGPHLESSHKPTARIKARPSAPPLTTHPPVVPEPVPYPDLSAGYRPAVACPCVRQGRGAKHPKGAGPPHSREDSVGGARVPQEDAILGYSRLCLAFRTKQRLAKDFCGFYKNLQKLLGDSRARGRVLGRSSGIVMILVRVRQSPAFYGVFAIWRA